MIKWTRKPELLIPHGGYEATVYVHDMPVLELDAWEGEPGDCWAAVSSASDQHTTEILVDLTCADVTSAKKRAIELAREVVKDLAKELGEAKK